MIQSSRLLSLLPSALFALPFVERYRFAKLNFGDRVGARAPELQSTADYKQENDAVRLTAKPEPIPVTIETFTSRAKATSF